MSIFELGDAIYDTVFFGKGTAKKEAENIEKAGQAYQKQMEDIAAKTKSAKDLYQEGRETAAMTANDKAGLAMKNAKAASMQQSGSKLLSAIQGAEAANKATQEGFDTASQNAANMAAGIQSQKNAALQAGAQGAFEGATKAAGLRTDAAQKAAQGFRQSVQNVGSWIQGMNKNKE